MSTWNTALKAWTVATAIGRAAFAVSLIFLTALLAWELADRLSDVLMERGYSEGDDEGFRLLGAPILLGAGAVSIGAILNFSRSILGSMVNLWEYVVIRKNLDLRREAITLFFTLLAITIPLAMVSDARGKRATPSFGWDVAYLARRPDSNPLFVFPFTFEPARVREKLASSWQNADHPFEPGPGVELDDAQEQRITELVEALKPCAGLGSDEQVRLEVIGFASSKHFEGFSGADSNELNLRAANARAEHVADKLRRARTAMTIAEAAIEISTDRHASFDEMAAERKFNDRPPGSKEANPAQLFTRAAWVKLLSAGKCALVEFEMP